MISASAPSDLGKVAGTPRAPLLIDVRREFWADGLSTGRSGVKLSRECAY
jgi:hypothetical protein